jgi:hypothetical protein
MKNWMFAAGALSAFIVLAPADAEAKKRGKTKTMPQVAGFVMTTGNTAGLLRSYERRQHDRVAGNDHVAQYFYRSQHNSGGR